MPYIEFMCKNPVEVAEEAMWLAWKACGNPSGMGILQDHPGATKKDVVANIRAAGDYPGLAKMKGLSDNELDADYVFGRMMKLYFRVGRGRVLYPEGTPRLDYQSWCGTYPTYEDLLASAQESTAN